MRPTAITNSVVVSNAIPEKKAAEKQWAVLSAVLFPCWVSGLCHIFVSIVGIVLGIINIAQKNPQKGMAIAGIILSVLGLLLTVAFIFIYVVLIAAAM